MVLKNNLLTRLRTQMKRRRASTGEDARRSTILVEKTKGPVAWALESVIEKIQRVTGTAKLRSATTFLALSASARACGIRSKAFITSGSVSARTLSPSS